MSILILADHDNGQLAAATLNTVTAATQIGGDIHVLVAGDASGDVAKAAAAIAGVSKVLTAGADVMAHGIAENIAPLIQSMAFWALRGGGGSARGRSREGPHSAPTPVAA